MAIDFNSKLYIERCKCFVDALALLNNAHQEDALEIASFGQTVDSNTGRDIYEANLFNSKYAIRFYLTDNDFSFEPGYHFIDFENDLLNKFTNKKLVVARIMTLISKIVKVGKKICDHHSYTYPADRPFYNRVRLVSNEGPNTIWLRQSGVQ